MFPAHPQSPSSLSLHLITCIMERHLSGALPSFYPPRLLPWSLLSICGYCSLHVPYSLRSLLLWYLLCFPSLLHTPSQCQSHIVILNDSLWSHFTANVDPRDIKSRAGPKWHCENAYFSFPDSLVVWMYASFFLCLCCLKLVDSLTDYNLFGVSEEGT